MVQPFDRLAFRPWVYLYVKLPHATEAGDGHLPYWLFWLGQGLRTQAMTRDFAFATVHFEIYQKYNAFTNDNVYFHKPQTGIIVTVCFKNKDKYLPDNKHVTDN